MKKALLVLLLALACTRDESKAAPGASPPSGQRRVGLGRQIPQDGQQRLAVDPKLVAPVADGADAGAP